MTVIENIRDIVIIIVAIAWSLVYLGLLAVTAVAGVLLTRYLGKARDLVDQQGRAIVGNVQAVATTASERTASLPHYGAGHEGQDGAGLPAPRFPRAPSQLNLSIPFFRRRKPWYERLLRR
jgi:hypothetical protein